MSVTGNYNVIQNDSKDVLKPILSCVTIERVEVMKPNKKFCDLNSKGEVDIFQEFRNICKSELEQLERGKW